MAQLNITIDEKIVRLLFSDERDRGFAMVLELIINKLLDAQASEQAGADTNERSQNRVTYRNGYYSRQLTTRVGTITLQVPRLRDGSFSTELFDRYQRNEKALVMTLMEMVINGVSTRKVTNITEELCGANFSKSTVSRLCQELDPIIQAWNSRSLLGKKYPFVMIDAMYTKVRENGRVVSRAVLIARSSPNLCVN